MLSKKSFVLTAFVAAGTLFAAPPIGTVTSSENFRLSGSEVSVAGVPSWPVLSGDELQTGAASAMIRFADGSRVIVNGNSRVSLDQTGSATRVKLLSGSLKYTSSKNSLLEVVANQMSSRTSSVSSGTAWIDGTNGLIAAASPIAGAIPAPIFRPGPLNLPTGNQLPNSTNPPNQNSPGAGSLTPFLSARP